MTKPIQEPMTEQELEDKILENTGSWINFTNLWKKFHGDKKRCFHKTNSMIDTSQLIMKKEGKEKLVKKADFSTTNEFEFGLKFQENMLRECRLALVTKVKKPLFLQRFTVIHTKNERHIRDAKKLKKKDRIMTIQQMKKKYEDYEEVIIWKPRHWIIIKHLERMLIYSNALLLFIDRANMHRTLGIINKSESKRRIEKIEKVLDNHFKKLEIETLDDYTGIRQWFYFFNIYKIENFKI